MNRKYLLRRGYPALLLLLVIIAAWPFLSRARLPLETDVELHVFRLAELARLVAGGEIYPRWAPNFYFGYGYPIFNYYAPLAYYLGLPFALAPGIDPVLATKIVLILTFLGAAVGMYGFVADRWGCSAGLVAAAAYLYAPYIQYVDPHARGDVAEFLSFGIFPLALWAFGRLQSSARPAMFAGAALLTALLILSHNLMALVFFALLCGWALWQAAIHLSDKGRAGIARGEWLKKRGIWPFIALALGVCLSAFFWLPVALEQDAVNLSTLIGDGGHFDFRNHFLSTAELFGPTPWLDWGATEPEFTLNLGMVQWLLALLGAGGMLTAFARHRAQGGFFLLAALLLIFLMTGASTPIWTNIPMMPYLQFPWRLLGPAAAMLAIYGGIGVQSATACLAQIGRSARAESKPGPIRQERALALLARWTPALAVAALLLQALPLTMVPPWASVITDTSVAAVTAIEREGRWLGTTSTADFVPRTVEIFPRPERTMLDQLLAGQTPDRVNSATLPQGVEVESESVTPLYTRYFVESGEPFLLRLFLFDFPGWQARIDGVIVGTQLGRPEGFLIIPVPAGEHVVDVEFVETVERQIAWLLAAAGLLITVAIALWLRWVAAEAGLRPVAAGPPALERKQREAARIAPMALVIALFVALSVLSHWQGLFHHRSQGWIAAPAQYDLYADLGGQLGLIGYDAPPQVSRGNMLEVTLYWKAQREMDINFQVFVHLLDADGTPVTQSDKLNPGEFPTRRWPTDRYVRDTHRLPIPESLAPGRYSLSTGMWVREEGWRLPLLDEAGVQIGDSVTLLEIEVR